MKADDTYLTFLSSNFSACPTCVHICCLSSIPTGCPRIPLSLIFLGLGSETPLFSCTINFCFSEGLFQPIYMLLQCSPEKTKRSHLTPRFFQLPLNILVFFYSKFQVSCFTVLTPYLLLSLSTTPVRLSSSLRHRYHSHQGYQCPLSCPNQRSILYPLQNQFGTQ